LLGGNDMMEQQAQSSGESSKNSEAMDIFGFPATFSNSDGYITLLRNYRRECNH